MIALRITLDTKQWEQSLTALEQKQMPFARFLAIKELGNQFQQAERERMARVFTLRKQEFIFREGVKRIGPAPSKANPTVTFGPSEKVDFLRRFEEGEPKFPTKGAGHQLAIPQQIRRNKRDIITSANRPRSLIQTNQRRKGAGRVFVLTQKRGRIGPGVFQTTGRKGAGALKFLYGFEPQVPSAPVLGFVETARHIAETRWPSIFEAALAEAMRTAR